MTSKNILKVPFYGNTKDNLHCFEACIKMVLKYFEPNKSFSWKELDKLSGKKKGMGSWPTTMLINLYKRGYTIEMWEKWDYLAFVKE